jgi:hypothetical protein
MPSVFWGQRGLGYYPVLDSFGAGSSGAAGGGGLSEAWHPKRAWLIQGLPLRAIARESVRPKLGSLYPLGRVPPVAPPSPNQRIPAMIRAYAKVMDFRVCRAGGSDLSPFPVEKDLVLN